MSHLEKWDDLDAARELFAKMKKAGIQPNAQIYNVMLRTCKKTDNIEAAQVLLAEMKAAGVQLDTSTYNPMLCIGAKAGDLDAHSARHPHLQHDAQRL